MSAQPDSLGYISHAAIHAEHEQALRDREAPYGLKYVPSAREEQARRDAAPSQAAERAGRALGAAAGAAVGLWGRLRRTALSVAGLGCLVGAASQLGTGWGLAAAGVALLALEALGGSSSGGDDDA